MHNTVKYACLLAVSLLWLCTFSSCIEDDITTSPSDQPEFSVETLDLGEFFTLTPSPTSRFVVYNRASKVLNISSISLEGGDKSPFRLNVDGEVGRTFSNVEIRPNDSIYIFVEMTLPSGGHTDYKPFKVTDKIDFLTNGITSTVTIEATGLDVEDFTDATITTDAVWEGHGRRIFGTLTVSEGATLTIKEGVTVYMHDKANIVVNGSLVIEGGPDGENSRMVAIRGDRLDNVVTDSPFDLLASQWGGIRFSPKSRGSIISHADIRGMTTGIEVESTELTLINSRLHRSGDNLLTATGATVTAIGCELSDSKGDLLNVSGGLVDFKQCTFANYYISSYDVGYLAAIDENSDARASFTDCIFVNYRNGLYVWPLDMIGLPYTFTSCMFPLGGTNDDNFIDCLWDADIITRVDVEKHIYDYRLADGSAGIDAGIWAGDSQAYAIDMYGVQRHKPKPTIGAYAFVPEPEPQP